jgi:enoyl-CoA hydratase/carnithine racemase
VTALVRYALADGVATVALDHPERRNALSPALLDQLIALLERTRDDDGVRCVVLASTHPTVFSSGGDLEWFSSPLPPARRRLSLERFPRMFELLGDLGKPTICAANGLVLAGALGLALACDLVVAAEEARFGTPELSVGLFPFMVTALLQRNVGPKKAAELLLLGDPIDAREAERIGLVNRVVPRAELEPAVAEWTQRLARRSPLLVRLGKQAMARQSDVSLRDALPNLAAELALALDTHDAREGMRAFLDKRDPIWEGR